MGLLSSLGGGTLGEVLVAVGVDTKQLDAGLAKAETETKTAGTSMSKLGVLSTAAFAVAGLAALKFGSDAIKATIDLNLAQTQLANSLANSKNAQLGEAAALTDLANKLRDTTGASNTAVISAESMLATFGLSQEAIVKLTPLVNDLSVKWGIDLTTAAKAVGKATQGVAGGLNRYGIIVDKTKEKIDPLTATTEALARVQGFAAARAKAEPWIMLGAAYQKLAQQVGSVLLPVLEKLVPIALVIVKNLGLIALAFASWFAIGHLSAIPAALEMVAGGLRAIGAAGAADALLGVAAAAEAVTAVLVPGAAVVAGYAIAFQGADAKVQAAQHSLEHLGISTQGMTAMQIGAAVQGARLSGAFEKQAAVANHDAAMLQGAADRTAQVGVEQDKAAAKTDKARQAFHTWASAAISALTAVSGGVTTLGKEWTTSAKQAVDGMNRMADMQKTLAGDIAKLNKLPVGETFKKFLIDQGPQAIHAFITSTDSQRKDFVAAFHKYETAASDTTKAIRHINDQGGKEAGKALADGVSAGISAGEAAAMLRAKLLGLHVVASLKSAMGVHSPSTEGTKAGTELVNGLVLGMTNNTARLVKAANDLVSALKSALGKGIDQATLDGGKALDKLVTQFSAHFDKLKQHLSSFKSGIRSGFSAFKDLFGMIGNALSQYQSDLANFKQAQASGTLSPGQVAPTAPDIHALIAKQVADTKSFADALLQLQKMGLSKANISALAAQGAAGLPEAQALLQDPTLIAAMNAAQSEIASVVDKTANALGDDYFGAAIKAASMRLHELEQALRAFIRSLPDKVQDKLGNLPGGSGAGGAGGYPGGWGSNPIPGPVNIYVTNHIAGHVTAERDLADTIARHLRLQKRGGQTLGLA